MTAIGLLLSACGTSGGRGDQLDGKSLQAELVGHTAELGGGFQEYYAADGTLRGTDGEQPYTGRWSIRGDQFCTDTTAYGGGCFTVARNRDGSWTWSRAVPVRAVLAGNPRGL